MKIELIQRIELNKKKEKDLKTKLQGVKILALVPVHVRFENGERLPFPVHYKCMQKGLRKKYTPPRRWFHKLDSDFTDSSFMNLDIPLTYKF